MKLRVLVILVFLACLGTVAADDDTPKPGWLGVMLEAGTDPASEDSSLTSGVRVRFVVDDGPAARAGLRAKDQILTLNGNPVSSSSELLALLRKEQPGNWIPLTVSRRGKERDVRVRLDDRPADVRRVALRRGWIGVHTMDLNPALREHFGAPSEAGVMIADVVPGSPAEAGGLMLGDVVYEIDGEPVRSSGEFVRRIQSGGVGNEVEILAARSGVEIELEALLVTRPPKQDS